MAKCRHCHQFKDTKFSYEGHEPLCEDCVGSYEQCVDCGFYFDPENIIAGRCPKCDAESED